MAVSSERRHVRSVLHLTESERVRLDAAAQRGDYRSTADYIRHVALKSANAVISAESEAAQG